MSALSKMELLKAAFANKASTGGDASWKKFYRFWSMNEGETAVVRFLPDADEENPMGFLVENLVHELHINGERKIVPCLEMYGEPCPICQLSRKYYDQKDEETGKKYYRKKSFIGQVLVIESPIEHDQDQLIKLVDFGPNIFKLIQSAFQSGDLELEPYALKQGYNFRFKKTKDGKWASYSTSSFQPKPTDIDDDIIEKLELVDLKLHRQRQISRAEIDAYLLADQTGSSIEAPVKNETPTESAPTPKVNTTKEEPAEQTPSAPTESSGNSVLQQLRDRAKAKAAAEAAGE
jgi:hypothetical protein